MHDLAALARGLTEHDDGIWRASARAAVDYPDEANAFCFAVEERSFWFDYRNRCILGLLRNFPPAGPIVDIGGGNGFVSLALQRAGYPTVVVEPGPIGAHNARDRGLSPVVCATLEDAAFRSASLDAAALFDVIEHVQDDGGLLGEVRRVLKPGSRLYLTVPAFRALWSAEDEAIGHHRRYTLSSLASRLAAAGFAVDYATYIFAPLVVPLFLLRTLPSRLGWRTSIDRARTAAELRPARGTVLRVVTALLDVEVTMVGRRRPIPFGTSCLVAARSAASPPSST
jgi:SAM-dependent methyltransferase